MTFPAPRSAATFASTWGSLRQIGHGFVPRCEVAWIEFVTDDEAKQFEKALHAEWLPPLSNR